MTPTPQTEPTPVFLASSTESPSTESPSTETPSTETPSTETIPTKTLPTETLPTETLPTEILPTEILPTETYWPKGRPRRITCSFCGEPVPVAAKGRIPEHHALCGQMVAALIRISTLIDQIEWPKNAKGEIAMSFVRSELMSAANQLNKYGPPRRIKPKVKSHAVRRKELLENLEWVNGRCGACGAKQEKGHKEGCPIDLELRSNKKGLVTKKKHAPRAR